MWWICAALGASLTVVDDPRPLTWPVPAVGTEASWVVSQRANIDDFDTEVLAAQSRTVTVEAAPRRGRVLTQHTDLLQRRAQTGFGLVTPAQLAAQSDGVQDLRITLDAEGAVTEVALLGDEPALQSLAAQLGAGQLPPPPKKVRPGEDWERTHRQRVVLDEPDLRGIIDLEVRSGATFLGWTAEGHAKLATHAEVWLRGLVMREGHSSTLGAFAEEAGVVLLDVGDGLPVWEARRQHLALAVGENDRRPTVVDTLTIASRDPALPGSCGPGRWLAATGRCAGAEAPWTVPRGQGWQRSAYLLPDGATLVVQQPTPESYREMWGEEADLVGSLVRLDPVTGASTPLSPPFPGKGAYPLSVAQPLLFLGPGALDVEEGRVRALDPDTGRWSERAAWPAPVPGASTLDVEGEIWLIGGADPAGRTWRYDPTSDRWSDQAGLPEARIWPAVMQLDEGPVACGGSDGLPLGETPPGNVAGCVAWRGGTWVPLKAPEATWLQAFRTQDRWLVLGDVDEQRRLWWVGDDGSWSDGPEPPADGWPTAVGPHVAWRGWDEDGERLWSLQGETWVPVPRLEGADPQQVAADTWVHTRRDDPPAFSRGDVLVDLDTDIFPSVTALPGGGLLVLGDEAAFRVDSAGLAHPVPLPPRMPHNPGLADLDDGTVLLFGGTDGSSNPLSEVWALRDGAWQARASAPFPMVARTLESLITQQWAGSLWVSGPFGTARLDLATDTWRMTELPEVMGFVDLGERCWWLGYPGKTQPTGWLDATGQAIPGPEAPTGLRFSGLARLGEQVLVAGGVAPDDYGGDQRTWLVDGTTGAWTGDSLLPQEHSGPSLQVLPDGRVLLLGGDHARAVVRGLDGTWTALPPTLQGWGKPVLSLLPDGSVLVSGDDADEQLGWERYHPGAREPVAPVLPGNRRREDEVASRQAQCLAGSTDACAALHRIQALVPDWEPLR